MKRYLLILLFTTFPFLPAKAIQTYTPKELLNLTWGSGDKQVALIQAPGNNFGPQRLIVNEAGTTLYLLDSPNRRIVMVTTANSQFTSIPLSSTAGEEADDFCTLDNGKHFYLLFAQQRKVILYNQNGKMLHTQPINSNWQPLSILCDSQRGLIFEAADGNFYRFNDAQPLTLIPQGKYNITLDRTNDSQGILWLHDYESNLSKEVTFTKRLDRIETVDFIGIDNQDNVYLSLEEAMEKTKTVQRFLRKYDSSSKLLAEVELPSSFYSYTLQDIAVTPSGEIFQMVPLREQVKLIKWLIVNENKGMKTRAYDPLGQQLFSYLQTRADDFLPAEAEVTEPSATQPINTTTPITMPGDTTTTSPSENSTPTAIPSENTATLPSENPTPSNTTTLPSDNTTTIPSNTTTPPSTPTEPSNDSEYFPPLTRSSILSRAKEYFNHRFSVSWNNITSRSGENLNGKRVISPIFKPGNYIGVPYKWGGFDSLESFNQGLAVGKKAGDQCATTCSGKGYGSIAVVGVDCSGFISRAWGLAKHTSTRNLHKVADPLVSYGYLKPGDIVNKTGSHVRLFFARNIRGRFLMYEASGRDWQVNTHSYTAYALSRDGYLPYRYRNVLDTSYDKQPQRLTIYGKKTLIEGQSSSYRTKVFYSDGTYRDVTTSAKWFEDSPTVEFKGTKLYAKSVSRNRYVYINATYTDKGKTVAARTSITIRNLRWRGVGGITNDPKTTAKPPIKIDLNYIYRANQGQDKPQSLTEGSVLYSGDYYKIIFTPTEKTYVYIFQTDSSGKIYRLFPMDSFNGVKVSNFNPTVPGKTYFVPTPDKSFFLDYQVGEETIYFIATRTPQTEFEGDYQQIVIAKESNDAAQSDLAQTKFFEEDIKYRPLATFSTATTPSNPLIWQENGEQLTIFPQRLQMCEGCMNRLKFWHR
jgi:cell wall-associated NlpC family hydrolase